MSIRTHTVSLDIEVVVDSRKHPIYDRSFSSVDLNVPNAEVMVQFPDEGNFLGLENKKLQAVLVRSVEPSDDFSIEAIYAGADPRVVRTTVTSHPTMAIDPIDSVDEYLMDCYDSIELYLERELVNDPLEESDPL